MKSVDSSFHSLQRSVLNEPGAPAQPTPRSMPGPGPGKAVAAPPPRSKQPQQPAPPPPVTDGDDGPTRVYVGGTVAIKSDYTASDVLLMTANALKRPLTSFVQSFADTGSKLVEGKPLSQQGRDAIASVTGHVDKVAGYTQIGGAQQLAGSALEAATKFATGASESADEMVADIHQAATVTGAKGTSTASRGSRPRGDAPGGKEKMDPESFSGLSSSGATQGGADKVTQASQGQPVELPPQDVASGESGPAAFHQRTVTLGVLKGEGPVNLEPALDAEDDAARLKHFGGQNASFFRNDVDVADMPEPARLDATPFEQRRGVLTFGKGEQATSFVPEGKAYLGRAWVPNEGPSELAGADIVKLGSGKDGTAALKLRFDDLAPGSTTIVTGGPMRGGTMLFAADQQGFYAYHADASSLNPKWTVSQDGARSILNAHEQMRPVAESAARPARGGARDDLVAAAKEYPFSALIYNGEYSSEPRRRSSDARIAAPLHAQGSNAAGQPWKMMTFNYFEPDSNLRTVGTAEAVIAKDMNGKVVVSVLGEKGKLDSMKTLDRHGGSVGFRYRLMDGATSTYEVPAAKGSR
jgi:hypothetical protein